MMITDYQVLSLIDHLTEKFESCNKEVEDWKKLKSTTLENYNYGRMFVYQEVLDLVKSYLKVNALRGLT